MSADLTPHELIQLVDRVFAPGADERKLAILVDLPDDGLVDNSDWLARRGMAIDWRDALASETGDRSIQASLFCYRNVKVNNAELPARVWPVGPSQQLVEHADHLADDASLSLLEVLESHPLVIALSELSATAPLKLLAPKTGCRAATMPGFSAAMIPALRLDYGEINRRVQALKKLLDGAGRADLTFFDKLQGEQYSLTLDLRYRFAHASGGILHQAGQAGNLPSGESYIVPYEGELQNQPSRSEGTLPVQLDGEVVHYRISNNKAVDVLGDGPVAQQERQRLQDEPAYGNLAELGLGVLDDFGLSPIGEILLDEKLGLHIAFGRSDHFGGQVAPEHFSSPAAVVHIDRVYLPETQPAVELRKLVLDERDGDALILMRDGRYVADL